MKDFLETSFPLDGKKLSLAGVSEKQKKMVSTSQKISCPLARISFFFEIYFPPNFNNSFH